MKKIFSFIILLLLVLPLGIQASAEEAPPYIDDQIGILTPTQVDSLRGMAREASEENGCGIYVIVVYDFSDMGYELNTPISQVLRNYFMDNGYGTGPDRDGVILMLSMAERDYSLFTNGFGDSGLSDPAMDHLVDTFLRDFKHDAWYNGFESYITCTDKLLQMTLDGHPYDENTPTAVEQIVGYVVSALISLGLASLITNHFVRKMKSVALQLNAENFAGDLHLMDQNDRYVNTTTTRVYDPPRSSSSSGGSRSGGGGGGCSRSGKF